MRPSDNLENKTLSDSYWRVQLVCMKNQAHSSLEPPLEYSQYQMPLMNQGSLWPFLTILGVTEICSFILVLERKEHKEIPEPSRLEFLENISANNFGVSDVEDNTSGPLNRGGIADLPLLITENTISKSPVVLRAKFMGSNGFFCFLSMCKFVQEPFCNNY